MEYRLASIRRQTIFIGFEGNTDDESRTRTLFVHWMISFVNVEHSSADHSEGQTLQRLQDEIANISRAHSIRRAEGDGSTNFIGKSFPMQSISRELFCQGNG